MSDTITMEQMLRRRDTAGGEMEMLAKVMSDPDQDRKTISAYIRQLLQTEHMSTNEAIEILAMLPHDPDALRNWARTVFATVMLQAIYAHAAWPRDLYPSPEPTPATPENEALLQ